MRLADLTIHLLLEKLTFTTTKLLIDRMAQGLEYIVTEDENIKRKLKDLTNDDYDEIRNFGVEAIQVVAGGPKASLSDDYTVGNDTITVFELSTKLLIVLNPTRSDYLKEIIHEQEDVKDKLRKLGYNCKTVLKRGEKRRSRAAIKVQYKPRRFISSATRNKYKKDAAWVPEVLRSLRAGIHGGLQNVPAVIIT